MICHVPTHERRTCKRFLPLCGLPKTLLRTTRHRTFTFMWAFPSASFCEGRGEEEPAFVPGKITFQLQFPPHMRSISRDSDSTMATVLGYMSSPGASRVVRDKGHEDSISKIKFVLRYFLLSSARGQRGLSEALSPCGWISRDRAWGITLGQRGPLRLSITQVPDT